MLRFVPLLIVLVLTGCARAVETTEAPVSIAELLRMNAAEIEGQDIGRLNLLCAQGLPGEYGDLAVELRTLDRWSEAVRSETQKHMHQFRSQPEKFRWSEGYFRMMVLITVLQQDFHVSYNPERDSSGAENPEPAQIFFANSADLLFTG